MNNENSTGCSPIKTGYSNNQFSDLSKITCVPPNNITLSSFSVKFTYLYVFFRFS